MTETLSDTMMQMLSSFEKKIEVRWQSKYRNMKEKQKALEGEVEKLNHDLKAVRKLALVKAPR